jgi:hypothetical protein
MTNTAVEAATPPTTGIMLMIRSWIDSAEPGTTAASTSTAKTLTTDTATNTTDDAENNTAASSDTATTLNTDATPDTVPNAKHNNARQHRKSLKEEKLKILATNDLGGANIGQRTRLIS